MADEQTNNLIDRYLNGLLSEEEHTAFEARLSQDDNLAKEVNLQKEVTQAIAGEKIHQLRAVLKDVDQNWGKKDVQVTSMSHFQRFRPYLAAASIVLIVAIGLFWFIRPKTTIPTEALFAANFEPYQMVLNKRSQEDSLDHKDEILNSAINTYTQGDYTRSADFFDQVIETEKNDVAFLFYRGMTLLASNQSQEAISYFTLVLDQGESLFTEQTQWYLGLAYLKSNDISNAQKSFKKIPVDAYKYTSAKEILEKINP